MAEPKAHAAQVKVTKPAPLLLKPVKLDYLKFFKALGTGAKDIATKQWQQVVGDAVDVAAAINLATTTEELAWTLLQRSVTKALFDLVGENNLRNLTENANSEISAAKTIEQLIKVQEISLDQGFFDRPASLEILPQLQAQLKAWLTGFGLAEVSAENISKRLPTHFQKALTEEWRRNAPAYKPILEELNSPFAKADDRELGWKNYDAHLQQQIEESVFDEPFSLSQIYVPLNAYYLEKPRSKAKEQGMQSTETTRRVVVALENELLHWIQTPDKDDLLRVISGGPGSGKSSFARIFAAKVSQTGGTRVLFVPLHLIDATGGLAAEIARYVKDEGLLAGDPLDGQNGEPDLLLILDGLDELASQGRIAAETARAFVHEVERTLERKNKQGVRLRVLLGGRELVVQENESEFRGARQILNLLPYTISEPERKPEANIYHDPEGLLKIDRREDWWKNYGLLTGNNKLTGLPKELKRPGLDEVTAQPLLNYLVALTYTRGRVTFDASVNLNVVYGDLVERVYEGGHNNKRRHAAIRDLELHEFQRVLEEIALAAWHGDGRSTTVREIQEHCQASNLGKLLEKFEKGAEAGVTRLLAAFFFRQHGQRASTGDRTFVFTHKSFGEYLAACRIVRAAERMVKQIEVRKHSVEDGWNERDALAHWAGLCGPSACTQYIKDFIHGEFRKRPEAEVHACRIALAALFSHMLETGMPMERVETIVNGNKRIGIGTFPEALYQSRNAEETLLVTLSCAAVVTKTLAKINDVERPRNANIGTWFRRIQGQSTGIDSCLAAKSFAYIGLSHSILHMGDFLGADLSNADLSGIDGYYICLASANLQEANLEGANLQRANLEGANLEGANLQAANLWGANLEGANLEGANLEGANLEGANLEGANLEGANLQRANLQRANLEGANLQKANLLMANLQGANLEGAKVKNTILEK